MTEYKRKKCINQNLAKNCRFFALLIVCVVFVVFSAIAIYLKNDGRKHPIVKGLIFDEKAKQQCFEVFIEEDHTLMQISQANDISFEKLCEVLNVDVDTDPETKIQELFENCDD